MPAATIAKGSAEGAPTEGGLVIPFARASNEYAEQFDQTTGLTLGAATAEQQPKNVLPGGYMRGVWLHVATTSSGSAGTGTAGAFWPFSMIQSVTLEDINGAPIIGPLTGFELYLANKYFGYFPYPADNRINFNFDASLASPDFTLWIPCEIRSDGLGSLANTDSRSLYRVRYTINSLAGAVASVGTMTTPTFSVTAVVETWSQVDPQSLDGQPQEQLPPGLGTTQFIVHETYVINSGQGITIKHNRVGNLIRNFLYYVLDGATPNALNDAFTSPIRVRLDEKYLRIEPVLTRFEKMAKRYGLTQTSGATTNTTPQRETGVYVYPQSMGIDGRPSPADDGDWLPTTEATYLALEETLGSFTGPGTLTILTNDVAPRGTVAV